MSSREEIKQQQQKIKQRQNIRKVNHTREISRGINGQKTKAKLNKQQYIYMKKGIKKERVNRQYL
jgi:hypothetical protein